MSYFKSILFLVLCLAVGVGLGKGFIWYTRSGHAKPDFSLSLAAPIVTGVGDAPAHRGFTLDAASLATLPAALQRCQETFGTTIALEYSPALTPEALAQAAQAIHQKHFSLALLPPKQFASQNPYQKTLAEIASEAQAAGVDLLCISWLNLEGDSDYWREQCQTVRGTFKGQIILAATPDILPRLSCLEAPDLIGAIGPIPLPRRLPNSPDEVTVHDLRVAWDCAITSIESLARANSKKIALLNISVPGNVSARLPAVGTPDHPKPNPELQKLLYEALLLETKGRTTWTEALLFATGISIDEAKIANAWDPKKPAPTDQAALEAIGIPAMPDLFGDLPEAPAP